MSKSDVTELWIPYYQIEGGKSMPVHQLVRDADKGYPSRGIAENMAQEVAHRKWKELQDMGLDLKVTPQIQKIRVVSTVTEVEKIDLVFV